jgi:hypothetical protein
VPVIADLSAELRPIRELAVRLTLEPTQFIPLAGNDFRSAIFEKLYLEGRAHNGFCGGGGLLGATYLVAPSAPSTATLTIDSFSVRAPLSAASGTAQFSVAGFIGYDDGDSYFVRVGGLLALNSPLGPGFESGKLLAGTLQFGGYFGGDDSSR